MPDDTAVSEAVDVLRQAMLDRGDDPGTVEAQLSAVKPKEVNLVGNIADMMRSPGPGPEEAPAGDGEEGGYETWTKAELQAELDAQGVEYNSGDTKADLIAKFEG